MNPSPEAVLVMLGVGVLSSLLTCAVVYLFWLRKILRNLVRFQTALQQAWAIRMQARNIEIVQPNDHLVARVKLKSGSGSISVYETGGKNIVRIDGTASDQEKERLMKYLKSEGFI
jgi:beta-lactamase superfamily II metal-dependent hydrolase